VANATGEGFEGRSYTVSGEDWEQFLSEVGSRDRGGRAHRLDHGPEASVYPWTEPLHAAVQPCPPRDPPVLARLEELLAARPSEEHVHVELEEQPLEQPRLRVGEVLPELPVSLPAVQCSRNGLVERVADRKSSPSRALKWCSSMRWPVPIAAAISRRLGPRIPPCLLRRGRKQPFPCLRGGRAAVYRLVHVPNGTRESGAAAGSSRTDRPRRLSARLGCHSLSRMAAVERR
jgi:hypothetical protein